MHLKLYFDSTRNILSVPANQGFSEVLDILKKLKKERKVVSEIVDTKNFSKENLWDVYSQAMVPSVFKKFKLRQIFGSRRRSASFFGREVPALLVFEKTEDQPEDVYPHEEMGRIITIKDFLERFLR
jgi:hypothetical protein